MTESALPPYGFYEDLSPELFQAAGDDAAQRAFHARAMERLESWHDGYRMHYRIRGSVLGTHGWKVVMTPFQYAEEADEDRVAAALASHASQLTGVALAPGQPPGRVWRSRNATPEALFGFLSAFYDWDGLITADAWPFILLAEGVGGYAVLAGPEPMLRAAFPDPARPWADFEADRAAQERICGRPWLRDLIAHYEPYALRS